MRRLRDIEPTSKLLAQAQALLDAEQPLPESRERMLRVRRALDQPRGVLARLRRLPAAAAAALVVLFGASAFAAVRVYVAVQAAASQPAQDAATSPVHAHKTKRVRRDAALEPSAQPAADAPSGPDPQAGVQPQAPAAPAAKSAAETPAQTGRVAHRGHTRMHDAGLDRATRRETERNPALARADEPAAPEPAQAPSDSEATAHASDSELVHRAVRALRSDHDPALAARLLEAHRARYPAGPLAEEVLSLQIEAALALRSPRAKALAREYLSRYPGGRYAEVAARALSDAAP